MRKSSLLVFLGLVCIGLSGGCATVDSKPVELEAIPANLPKIGIIRDDINLSRAHLKDSPEKIDLRMIQHFRTLSNYHVSDDVTRPLKLSMAIDCDSSTFGPAVLFSFLSFVAPPMMFVPIKKSMDYEIKYNVVDQTKKVLLENSLKDEVTGRHRGYCFWRLGAVSSLAKQEANFVVENSCRLVLNDIYKNADKLAGAAGGTRSQILAVVVQSQPVQPQPQPKPKPQPQPQPQEPVVPETQAPTVSSAPLPPPPKDRETSAVAQLATYSVSQGEAQTLTDKLRTTLVQVKYFRIVSRDDMNTVLKEQQFTKTASCDDTQCLIEMGKLLAVQKIIGGTIGKVGSTYVLSLRMVDVETGETAFSLDRNMKGAVDDLLITVEEVGKEMIREYGKSKQ